MLTDHAHLSMILWPSLGTLVEAGIRDCSVPCLGYQLLQPDCFKSVPVSAVRNDIYADQGTMYRYILIIKGAVAPAVMVAARSIQTKGAAISLAGRYPLIDFHKRDYL